MGQGRVKYTVGRYRLQLLNGEYCAVWASKENPRHRRRLGIFKGEPEDKAKLELDRFAKTLNVLESVDKQTIQEIWDLYIADRKADGKNMEVFEYNWKALAPRFAQLVPSDVTADLCRSYAKDRFEAGKEVKVRHGDELVIERRDISPSTVWTELVRLRQCLLWAEERHLIPRAPYVWVPSPTKPRQRVLSELEFWSLIDTVTNPHVKLFILLAIATGGRHTAILELTWDRVDFDTGIINLKTDIDRDPMSKRSYKGRATVAMNNLIIAALKEAEEGATSNYVIEWDGQPLKSIKKAFQRAARKAGLTGVTPHTLRHTTATWLTEGDVPMEQVARFLGHKVTTTTEKVYSKPKGGQLAEAAKVIDLRLKQARKSA
jgi:integrase